MCGDQGGLLSSAALGDQPDVFLTSTSPGVSDRKEGRLVNSSQPSAPENRLNGDPERAPNLLASYTVETRAEYVQALNCSEGSREGCSGVPVVNAGNIQRC